MRFQLALRAHHVPEILILLPARDRALSLHVFIWIFVAAGSLLLVGFLYEFIDARFGRRRFASRARFVKLMDGATLFVRQEGSGRPTVVFEAGIGASSLNWRYIQQAVARTTSTIAYDRAGLGWSSLRRTGTVPRRGGWALMCLLESFADYGESETSSRQTRLNRALSNE